jgi:hypothetical protein
MSAAYRLRGQVFTIPRLRNSANRTLVYFHCFQTTERKTVSEPSIKTLDQRRSLAEAEVTAPSGQVMTELLDHRFHANSTGPSRQAPYSLLCTARLPSAHRRRIYNQRPLWIWASLSIANSPSAVCLLSGSCSSTRAFTPRFLQTRLATTPLRFANSSPPSG